MTLAIIAMKKRGFDMYKVMGKSFDSFDELTTWVWNVYNINFEGGLISELSEDTKRLAVEELNMVLMDIETKASEYE